MKSNINSKPIGRLLVALLAIAISLGAPHAYAGDAEDKTKAADKATGEAEKAKSDYDKAAGAEGKYEDAQKAAEAAEDDADQARDALKKAEEDLKDAKNSGDKDKIKKAQDDRNKKDQDAKDAEKTEEQKKADRDKAKKDADEAAKKLDALRKAKRDARKAARDAIKAAKDAIKKMDKTNPDKDKLKEDLDKIKDRLALGLQPAGSAALATLTASGKVKADIAGTGETIGHIADLKIQNLTDQSLTCAITPMILESSSGKNQHYACPRGQTVALNPQETKTVPINGVCLNRNKPPVAKGVSGDLVINEANPSVPQNPNTHLSTTDAGKLLRSCAAKYTAADQLQKSGALKDLPYHDPQKQKDIVVQWSTWVDPDISQMTKSPPATKEDLRKVVYKQVEEQGPMSPEKKKKVDQGIDTIFEKVELTTAKAKDLEKTEGANSPPAETPAD